MLSRVCSKPHLTLFAFLMKLCSKQSGMTFIELLLVLGILAVLLVILFLNVQPRKVLLKARDSSRAAVSREMQKAIQQYVTDHGTDFAAEVGIGFGSENARQICRRTARTTGCVNLDILVPAYLTDLPVDHAEPCVNYTGFSVNKTGVGYAVAPVQLGKFFGEGITDVNCGPFWSGIVGHWPLDETTSPSLDLSQFSNTAFWIVNPTSSTSVPQIQGLVGGRSLSFNGTDTRLLANNAPSLQLTNGTISGWMKTSYGGPVWMTIATKSQAYGLFLAGGLVTVYDWSLGTSQSAPSLVNDNSWHHVAVTFQSGVAGGTKVYVDGALNLTMISTVLNQSGDLTIGSNGSGEVFNGLLDDIRVYNRVLSATEISWIAHGAP